MTRTVPPTGLTNWSGNHHYVAPRFHEPTTVDELVGLITGSTTVKILGTRHAFNDIADTDGDLVSLAGLPTDIAINDTAATVTLTGAVTYGMLAPVLHEAGWALPNLASLPHVGVAGAVATGTHGSGDAIGSLATAVSGIEILTGDGEVVELDRGTGAFRGAVVNLGAFGAVVRLTLDLIPTFDVAQYVFEGLPFDDLLDDLDAVTGAGYSVSLFTTWDGDTIPRVLVKSVGDAVPTVAGTTPATESLGPAWTTQLGEPGPWSERLAHFRLDSTPSVGEEIQSEYLVDRADAVAAIRAVRALTERVTPLLYATEIRTVAASDLWLDPAYGRDSVAIHFTWKRDQQAVLAVLPSIEAALAPFAPRPHWGKLFTLEAAQLTPRYDKLADFRWMADYFDPRGKFRNDYLRRTVFGA
ncbi:MAG: D-arabinono-1,4-lactone oxidase [Nakamurella sp.]